MYTYTLTETELDKCKQFADLRIRDVSTKLYQLRGELNSDKIYKDIASGAKAEFAAYNYLRRLGLNPTEPDLTIHGNKSFSADIKAGDSEYHVKSQTIESANKHGLSWLFQKSDKLLTLPSESTYVVFCVVDGNTVTIKKLISAIDISESDVVKSPKIPRYASTKAAIYWSDLELLS